MKLLVDARCFQDSAYAKRGIGRHAAGILRHARTYLPAPLEIVGLLDPTLKDVSSDHAALFDAVQYHVTPPPESEGAAVFLQPSPMTHPANRIAPLLERSHILSCEIFYDLVPLDNPDYYLPGIGTRQAYLGSLLWLKHYRLHAPISRHSLNCISDLVGVSESQAAITGACLRPVFSNFDPAKVPSVPRCCRFASGDYFIMVGGEDPRKNTDKILAAHARLAKRGIRTRLLVVGLYAECVIEKLLHQHRERGGDYRDVQFLHGISDEELTALYFHATACLCPSNNEGFSLPIVEAMACRVPVLAASCPAQAELVVQADALFDPENIEEIAAAMQRILTEKDYRENLLRKQARVAPRYGEEDVAARVWMLVRRHLPQPVTVRKSQRSARSRLAFLTPYPSRDEKEVGYLPAVLRSLSASADITVFSHQNHPRPDSWIESFEPLSALAHLSNGFDRIATVLDQSPEMRRYFWLAERYGGCCLLYRSNLGPFYAETFGLQRTAQVAERSLRREITRGELNSWLDDLPQARSRFVEEVARWADPLLVHSRLVQQEIDPQSTGTVEFLPPCFDTAFEEWELTPANRKKAREGLGLSADRIHILVPDAQIAEAVIPLMIHAFEQLRTWKIDAELHFFTASDKLAATATQVGVAEFVHVANGPIDETVRRAYFLAVDLGLCLQTSGTTGVPTELFELLSAGIPTITNRELAQGFAISPLVMEVPDLPSSVLIAEQWLLAIQSGGHLQRLTPERRRFVDERCPERHAKTLLHMLKVA